MTKKLLWLFTTIVAALAVVGVAWASGDDDTSTSITAATETSASVSSDVSTPSTEGTVPDSSTSTSVNASTSTSAEGSTSTSLDNDPTSTTSTSIAATTSTSIDDDDDDATTSTTVDDNDRVVVPDGITTHNIPGVGAVSIEVSGGQLFLVTVFAPGWTVEHDKIESDRIELEFTNGDAEAEFEARINDARVEVDVEIDSD
jgi:hypothetical protein